MTGDMMIGDEVTVLGNDRAAAHGLHLHFAPFTILGRNHVNAHEGWPQLVNRRFNDCSHISRNFVGLGSPVKDCEAYRAADQPASQQHPAARVSSHNLYFVEVLASSNR